MSERKVFVSYSHTDNEELYRLKWVSLFAERLQTQLRMFQGDKKIEVWIDHRMERARAVDAALQEQLGLAGAFLAIASPSYVTSEWCPWELVQFINKRGCGGTKDERVFLAEFLPVDRAQLHEATRNLVSYKFWMQEFSSCAPQTLGLTVDQHPGPAYWSELRELAYAIGKRIAKDAKDISGQGARRKVWIAVPTDDLEGCWKDLVAALDQAGVEVLASDQVDVAGTDADLNEAMKSGLESSDVFVQLLGGVVGKRRAGMSTPLPQLQHQAMKLAAQKRGIPLLIWRAPELVLETVTDLAHHKLLKGATACRFQEFIALVKQALQPAEPKTPFTPTLAPAPSGLLVPKPDAPLVCLTSDVADISLRDEVSDILFSLGAGVAFPTSTADHATTSEWRQHNEDLFSTSDGLLLLHGQAPAGWVQSQLMNARKTLSARRSSTRLSLLNGPPPDKPPLSLRLPNLLTLDCCAGIHREPLARFVGQLGQGGTAHA